MLEKILESPLERTLESPKEIKSVSPKGNHFWILIGKTDAEVKTPILWLPATKNWLIGKDPDAGKDWKHEEKGTTEDEIVGWHHWLDVYESEQAPWRAAVHGVAKSQTRLSDWTELNWDVHFELIFVWSVRFRVIFISLPMTIQVIQHCLLKKIILQPLDCLCLSSLSWVYVCGCIPGFLILFYWSTCLSHCHYHTVSITLIMY